MAKRPKLVLGMAGLLGALLLLVATIGTLITKASAESPQPSVNTGAAPAHLPIVPCPLPGPPELGSPTDAYLDRTPPRQTKGLDLVKLGWTYNCMECHRLLQAKWHYDRPMVEHQDIVLVHGENRFCLNCHHPTNRNAFVDYDGSEIAEADVVKLCGKCHGPIYRDWQAGVHGRHNGFWDASKGPQTLLRCIQCHDPHQPKFQAMKPKAPLRYPARAPGGDVETGASQEKHAP